jgi:hypothetical protein
MASSEEDYSEIDGWEKEDYKELSDSERSNISYMDESDDEVNKKRSPPKKKKKKKQEPEGLNISEKPKIEYSNILQEENDFVPE